MISLTGILTLPLLMHYSTILHTRSIRSDGSNKETVVKMMAVWWMFCIVPVAITFHSTLMGYVCYIVLFGLIITTLDHFFNARFRDIELEIFAMSASIIVFSSIIAGICGVKESIL